MVQKLIFSDIDGENSTDIPAPVSFGIENEKQMSENAGRTSLNKYVGDIKGIITTIHIEWAHLTPAQVKIINSFISNTEKMFFNITYCNEEFETITKTVYSLSASYEQWGWDTHRRFCKILAADLYEQ